MATIHKVTVTTVEGTDMFYSVSFYDEQDNRVDKYKSLKDLVRGVVEHDLIDGFAIERYTIDVS